MDEDQVREIVRDELLKLFAPAIPAMMDGLTGLVGGGDISGSINGLFGDMFSGFTKGD